MEIYIQIRLSYSLHSSEIEECGSSLHIEENYNFKWLQIFVEENKCIGGKEGRN